MAFRWFIVAERRPGDSGGELFFIFVVVVVVGVGVGVLTANYKVLEICYAGCQHDKSLTVSFYRLRFTIFGWKIQNKKNSSLYIPFERFRRIMHKTFSTSRSVVFGGKMYFRHKFSLCVSGR